MESASVDFIQLTTEGRQHTTDQNDTINILTQNEHANAMK